MNSSKKQQWNHNNNYHKWLLSQLPQNVENALDIGCGQGYFAQELAQIALHVDAVDIDINILKEAAYLNSYIKTINFILGDFIQLQLPAEHYDIVTAIDSIHHMELKKALEEISRVLKPSGVVAILGLYRMTTIIDLATFLAAVPIDRINKYIIHRHERGYIGMTALIQEPSQSLVEIRKLSNEILPGSRLRRHLFYRYSIIWQKPVPSVNI